MKKRITSFLLALGMLTGQAAGMPLLSEDGKNMYGHTVTYEPVTQLYTGGETIRFFDSQITEWNNIDSNDIIQNEAESIKWLSENNYLLNHFGRRYPTTVEVPGCFNSKGEWQTQIKGPNNVRKWYGNVVFDKLSEPEERKNGNISNMFDKGDLQYFFSWKVKTVQTSWKLFDKSNDTGITTALGESTFSSGGGWKKYNTLGDGPNLGNFSAWKPAKKLKFISFSASSDKDDRVDSYLSGAMLVGRDIKGPQISSVEVTADKDGTKTIENGVITLDTIDSLTDRTVYFRVQWDEPVVFDENSKKDIEKLSLKVETIGIDGTSGMAAEAPFLEFAPSKNDAAPVMIFEYKIADPYTDTSTVAQERGFFYRFSNVTVSQNQNDTLWNGIYDISGNKFASDENGNQPSGKVVTAINGSTYVDLMPFGIENIRVTKDQNDGNAFIKAGGLLGITLELNKELAQDAKIEDLPEITLNIKDSSNNYVTIKPSKNDLEKKLKVGDIWKKFGYFYNASGRLQPVMLGYDNKSITYYTQLYDGFTMDGNSVNVTSVSSGKNKLRDNSGYSLMNYSFDGDMLSPVDIPGGAESKLSSYTVAPDKQYRFDFDAPIINLSVSETENGIILLTASAEDNSLVGCDAEFTVTVNGRTSNEGISYQAATSESYKESEWKQIENNAMAASFGSPIIETDMGGNAYGFIRLPKNCETDTIKVGVTVTDEAQNSSSTEETFSSPDWDGYDTLAPSINLSVKGEEIDVDISDIDDEVEYSYGFSEDENTEPAYVDEQGKSGTISAPELPDGNEIFTRVLWIKATDSKGNESEISKLPVKYDRTYTEIIIEKADTDKKYRAGEYPIVYFKVKEATAYWCVWAEKPANTSDSAAYIAEHCLEDIRAIARDIGIRFSSDDGTPTEFNNRISEIDAYSSVAAIDSESESYGEAVQIGKTSRPIMLVIGAEKEDGTTLVKTIEFDAFYGTPKVNVQQNRFSTNNSIGKRTDYVSGSENTKLLRASDGEYSLNTPCLFGFAQAEFRLVGDPLTGLDFVNAAESSITLERVVYSGTDLSGEEKNRRTVAAWKFTDLGLGGSDTAVVDIDPSSIDTKYCEVDDDGNRLAVRYEFICNMSYTDDIKNTKTPITYFAFNNEPTAYLCDTQYDTGEWTMRLNDFGIYEKKNVEAVFDKKGKDITVNIPVYTVSTSYPETYGYGEYIRFAANGMSYDNDSDNAYYNHAKMIMRIGTDYKNLSELLSFDATDYGGTISENYDIGRYLFGNEDEVFEKTLYYQFEYPECGTASPIYVMKIRRDNVEPTFDISVSETEALTNEVTLKLNGVYDIQKSSDGMIFVDTTESDLRGNGYFMFEAFRKMTENDDPDSIPEEDIYPQWIGYDEETETNIYENYVRIYPDENGIYHFISNGYFSASATDNAGNRSSSVVINGEIVREREGSDFPYYYIDNVFNEPPKFVGTPSFAEDDGKFTLNAKTDTNVKNVYLKFDKAYSELISDDISEEGGMYDIKNVPGMSAGGFDSENGEINAEIYVKAESELNSVILIIETGAGSKTEYAYTFKNPIRGKSAEITNTKNENGYPVYGYGETLNFNVPVKVDGTDGEYSLSCGKLILFSDGITQVTYTDLFGESKTESIYADIFGAAFAHDLIFSADGKEITAQTKISSGEIEITVDTSKTKNLSVDGGTNKFTFTENGNLSYTLTNSELGETRTFNVPVTNIDNTVPEAIVSVNIDSERDAETNKRYIYSVTYSIEGFSKDNTVIIPSENGAAPSSVTFDGASENKKYTFRFRDEAGNIGSYTADVTDIEFSDRKDNKISDYRLTYMIPDENGFKTIGEFKANDAVNLNLVNSAISVKIEALNQNGENVSAVVSENGSLPEGTAVYNTEKLVMFTAESNEDRTVELKLTGTGTDNSINVSVMLPANTIDMTPPSGTVNYRADGNIVKAYLVTEDTDLAEVDVVGTKADKTAFELKTDENGYYTELDSNGIGKFVLLDKAGNIGNVAIAVLTIDTEPPQLVSEGWQSGIEATTPEEIKKLLQTPTNSSIKLFITFNEQLSRVDTEAFENGEDTQKLVPTEEYVTAVASGTTITVEFKQNCRARLTVYDLRGNGYTLWRPEDGPITAIDRDIPKLAQGYPNRIIDNNEVIIEYVFADNEEVMLLQDHEGGYKNRHRVKFSENGTKIVNFTDRAGNVYSDYPIITEIDELAPRVKMSVDYVGSGSVLSGNDSYKAGNVYTSKNVRILLSVEDETADGIAVTAKTKSGAEIKVNAESVKSNEKSYNYNFVVSENGSYTVTAKDKWGNESTVETSVSVIDRTAPTIRLGESTVIVKSGTSEDELKTRILNNTTAVDLQSGADSPMGDRFGTVTDGVRVYVDLSGVKLDKDGKYTAKITASDRLGNTSEKSCVVSVLKDVYTFNVNGSQIYANDVFTTSKGKIRIRGASKNAKYYYAQGYKTMAQMKYAKGFDASIGFDAEQNGYYTVMAQEEGRKMYLLYVYIN